MDEISGMGGSYEKLCQDMLEAGVEWIMEHESFEFAASGHQGVVGIIYPDNEDTAELIRVIVKATNGEATPAMVHAVMLRLNYIAQHGWSAYQRMCREKDQRRIN